MLSYSGESVSQNSACVHTDFLANAARVWMRFLGQRPAGRNAFSVYLCLSVSLSTLSTLSVMQPGSERDQGQVTPPGQVAIAGAFPT